MRRDHEFNLYEKQTDEDAKARQALTARQIWYGPKASNPFLKKLIIREGIGSSQSNLEAIRGFGVSIKASPTGYTARHIQVIAIVSHLTDLTVEEIRGEGRNSKTLAARCAIANILRFHLGYSTPHIGRILKRDHSTILHSLRKHSPAIKSLIENTYAELRVCR